MTSSVKWLHFSSSGRNCAKLFFGLLVCLGPLFGAGVYFDQQDQTNYAYICAGVGCTAALVWLLYWLGNTAHSMDLSYAGKPPGGGVPARYDGTWDA